MFRNNSLTRRAALKTAAVLAASTLVLSGCSRGDDAAASKNEGTGDERIAAVGLGDSDTLLALGIQPVLVAPWGAEGDVDASGVGPWATEKLGENKPEVVYGTASGFTAEILEKISAADHAPAGSSAFCDQSPASTASSVLLSAPNFRSNDETFFFTVTSA